MALSLMADAWARAHGGHILALTVDHGLRAESAAEAAQVGAWMAARNIRHCILTPAPAAHSNNLQNNARQRRYDALADACRAEGILHCLIAHHAGDQRETTAHNLARGETADGAAGMAMLRNYHGVRFLRPLLGVEHAALTDYLCAQRCEWVEDPSNTNATFARVRTRMALASDAGHTEQLAHLAEREGADRAARDEALARAAMQCVALHPLGYAELSITEWHTLSNGMATRLLADTLRCISGSTYRPRTSDTLRLADALPTLARTRTLHGCEVARHGDTIRIAREFARVVPPLTLSGEGRARWDGRFRLYYRLPPGAGYRIGALGRHARHYGLPRATPALWHLDEPYHVPHIAGAGALPEGVSITLGFAPAKPLAAAPFWWLNSQEFEPLNCQDPLT